MRPPLRVPLGLLLAGYGALVLVGVMPHESALAGGAAALLGLLLLLPDLSRIPAPPPALARRGRWVAAGGAGLAAAVLLYNLARRSGLSPPEWALLAYGVGLVAAAPFLDARLGPLPVATAVGWSFPLLLAPLLLFAGNAALSSASAGTAAAPLVQALVVQPAAWGLRLSGVRTDVVGSTLVLATPRGGLSLGVGLVCAGLYPIVLFGGLVACHAWTDGMGKRRAAALMAAGLAGLWLVNLVRLVALARVGIAWGPGALQAAHANLGWLLFALYTAAFWAVALRVKAAPRVPA